jgi:two-component system response regulator FixJ
MTRRTVYVVDDEGPIRGALKMMLGVQGFTVTPFASGAAFLEVSASLVPGCVLLDIRMPDLDGIEVQQQLAVARAELPVVMMTGHADLGVAAAALRNGAVGLVEKPFAKATLRRALDAAFLRLEDPAGYEDHLETTRAAVAALAGEDRALLVQLAGGGSNELIAVALGVSLPQVEMRRAELFAELGIESVNEAAIIAHVAGLGAEAH